MVAYIAEWDYTFGSIIQYNSAHSHQFFQFRFLSPHVSKSHSLQIQPPNLTMKTSSLATAAAILSASNAATVTLETTKCLSSNVPLQQLEIEMNLSGPVARGNLPPQKAYTT
jgi:hypothetical protein